MSSKNKKRSKPQGKLDPKKVLEGLQMGLKKHVIAERAGSIATTTEAKCNAVARVMRSDEFKRQAHDVIQRSYDAITEEKLANANYTALTSGIERLSKVAGLAGVSGVSDDQKIINVQVDKVLNYYANGELQQGD